MKKFYTIIINLDPLECFKIEHTNWDVSDEELTLCIHEQIYGDIFV
jgi:hypothetical protein